MSDTRFKEKSVDELISSLDGVAEVGSKVHEQLKLAVLRKLSLEIVSSSADLSKAILQSGAESAKLAQKLLWLNIILAVSSVIYTAATVFSVMKTVQ